MNTFKCFHAVGHAPKILSHPIGSATKDIARFSIKNARTSTAVSSIFHVELQSGAVLYINLHASNGKVACGISSKANIEF